MAPVQVAAMALALVFGVLLRGVELVSLNSLAIIVSVLVALYAVVNSRQQLREHPQQRELLLVDADDYTGLTEAPIPIVVPWAIGSAPVPALSPGAPQPTVVGNATAFRRWAAASIRADTVLPSRTRANKLMVETCVKRFLEEHGVRKTHISQHLPVIVAMLFIPSKADVESRLLLGSSVAHHQDALMRGSTWLQWFWGTKPLEFSK